MVVLRLIVGENASLSNEPLSNYIFIAHPLSPRPPTVVTLSTQTGVARVTMATPACQWASLAARAHAPESWALATPLPRAVPWTR